MMTSWLPNGVGSSNLFPFEGMTVGDKFAITMWLLLKCVEFETLIQEECQATHNVVDVERMVWKVVFDV